MLFRSKNTIHHVSDGSQALDYLFRKNQFADDALSPRPHLILLDLRMPKIDGLEVLRQIKSNDQTMAIPTVILTTSNADQDIAKAYEFSANSYLVKPVDFELFSKLMNDIGTYWLSWNINEKP